MRCAWQTFIHLLPPWLREEVDRLGKDELQELRLRLGQVPELRLQGRSVFLRRSIRSEDISFCINSASHYSPWSAQTTAKGYITAPGGHRLGICGEATVCNGSMTGVRSVNSLCLRVARDFPNIASTADTITGSILIIGKPGSGKTTLLRDLIRRCSDQGACNVSVVDEKRELFPLDNGDFCFPPGKRTDVLSGCSKKDGILSVLRNMGPDMIAVDEITSAEDCSALLHAGWCGVRLLATAHAESLQDLCSRPVYRPLVDNKLFQTILILRPDKSWFTERMEI